MFFNCQYCIDSTNNNQLLPYLTKIQGLNADAVIGYFIC
jgi:hypothetical protein